LSDDLRIEPSSDPDAQLMMRVRDDDAEAYQALLIAYQPRLQRVLQCSVGSVTLAEDLVQDIFLRVWRARKSYQPTAKFSTWIFHIASNVANNAVRDRSRKREVQATGSSEESNGGMVLDQMVMASTGTLPVRKLD
jgi:RNA polymerase sigma-70 factor (ECF subfamily)